ncbi:MAG: capping complex subunit for YIEGIA [Tumebacillaceae bacterium]
MSRRYTREIVALVTTESNKNKLGGGKGQVFLADSDEQCVKLAHELSGAIHGEVVALSNGIYVIFEV